jgi:ABC-type Fe3+-hydroxamate transport system substrate-binding protein
MKLFLFCYVNLDTMPTLRDQLGDSIQISDYPQRIVSLVPSISEYLNDLGVIKELVGVTKFCVHPKNLRERVTVIGGTKQQHLDKIEALEPTLIIANKEENEKQYIDKLKKICPVYVSRVDTFDSAITMMNDLARLTAKTGVADRLINNIKQQFDSIKKPNRTLKIAYAIWKKPWMWAGSDTFINEMLNYAGYQNIVQNMRYPEIEMEEIINKKPDYIFLSSEPFPFRQQHMEELSHEYPAAKFILVDGEIFSWYGSRMLNAPAYFHLLLEKLKSEGL